MAIGNHRAIVLVSILAVLLVSVFGYWMLNRGYGKVSPETYEYSKALYGACLKKDEVHLAKVEEMIKSADETQITNKERQWLLKIVARARNGYWEHAAQQAKRLMEDQVEW